MKRTVRIFAGKLFGRDGERLKKTLPVWLIVYAGLRSAGVRVPVAPSILYLMSGTFSAGVMWQSLCSGDQAESMKNLIMLPYDRRELVFSYVGTLGMYTLLTKTAGLLAVVLAVGSWSGTEVITGIAASASAILLAACVYGVRGTVHGAESVRRCSARNGQSGERHVPVEQGGSGQSGERHVPVEQEGSGQSGERYVPVEQGGTDQSGARRVLWRYGGTGLLLAFQVCLLLAAVFLRWESIWCLALFAGSAVALVLVLCGMDAYAFYAPEGRPVRRVRAGRSSGSSETGRCVLPGRYLSGRLILRYLFRYLRVHKNYLMNTVILWGVACVLPVLLKQVGVSALPVGFAILSLNTPLCILLSCDPATERAVRFLPGQGRRFFVPYGVFLAADYLLANLVFLVSWQLMNGGVGVTAVAAAVCMALPAAAGSVLLERFYPLRGWKIESDLWHHPRKYLVPAAMLLLAGGVGMLM